MLRRQLPVLSPLTPGDVGRALRRRLRRGGSARAELAALLRDEFDATSVTLFASGTQALQVAIRTAAGRGGGASDRSAAPDAREGPVALPAFCCYDVVTAAVGAGVRTTFYDLDPDTLGPDLESLERTLEEGARAAVIAPLYGLPVDWDAVEAVASSHGALLIEDAAQAAGARWKGRPVGSLGPLSVLSFGRGKGWTGGGGGALLDRRRSEDRTIAERRTPTDVRTTADEPSPEEASATADLRTLGVALAQAVLGRPSLYGLPASLPWLHLGETRYRPPTPPAPMPEAAAALALETHDRLEGELEVRRRNARWFLERLGGDENPAVRVLRGAPEGEPGYLRLPARTMRTSNSGLGRALESVGIARSYPRILPDLPVVRAAANAPPHDVPGARTLATDLITLPTHSNVTPDDREAVLEALI